ncbi:MAG: hypothetical protein JXA21_26470 [Anaerolineae bacterium]|nr:hypothetical protein [Anaerolineae bacterium]
MTQQPKYQYPTTSSDPTPVESYEFQPNPIRGLPGAALAREAPVHVHALLPRAAQGNPRAGGRKLAQQALLGQQPSSNIANAAQAAKSFHLDPYCFDSDPERNLFWDLLRDGRVTKFYFTGMLTHGQSEFYVQYIAPDFLVQKDDSSYVIIEVKGDNLIDAPVVLAKKVSAEQMAAASGMTYEMIKGNDANAGRCGFLLEEPIERAEHVRL